jgi:iron uptake system EfeUOB component EfeO/EfeM
MIYRVRATDKEQIADLKIGPYSLVAGAGELLNDFADEFLGVAEKH